MNPPNNDSELIDESGLPPDQQEDESDLRAGRISYSNTLSMTVDWTIETIFGQVTKHNIDLDPAFQRRSAWDVVRKSRLIESLLIGLPVPNIVLAENKAHRGRFIVIDGKQRVLSIADFMRNSFELKGLDIREDLSGKKYRDLDEEDKAAFDNATFRSTVIKGWSDDQLLYAIFYRLNSGSLPLSPQELRRALVGGNFLEAIEEYVINSAAFRANISATLDRRMRDSELVLRFVSFDLFLKEYEGNLKDFLDSATQQFERNWTSRKAEASASFARLDLALNTASAVFGGHAFRKWTDDRYERTINRAVFDVITRYFSDDKVAAASRQLAQSVETAFKDVSSDQSFRQAIERTTKTISATHTRLDLWGSALAKTLGMKFDETSKRILP
jgi:hypothetical protein